MRVAVVGAGRMGNGIAQVFASAGHMVFITDVDREVLANAPARMEGTLKRVGTPAQAVLERVSPKASLEEAVATADIVFEAAPEKLDLKAALFERIAANAPADAILASNTSVIPITAIGQGLPEKARRRLLGTHWWNPPYLIPLVEVIRTVFTDPDYFERVFTLLEEAGKTPVKVMRDVPGFIGNRLQMALWREALGLVEAGICDAETIDTVVKQSFGRRLAVLGPMENMDLIGLELTRDIHRVLFPHLNNSAEPSPVIEKSISQGKNGMRSGAGLRSWTRQEAEAVESTLADSLLAQNRGI